MARFLMCLIYVNCVFLFKSGRDDTPEEIVSHTHIPYGPPQQKPHQVTVQITLILQSLFNTQRQKDENQKAIIKWVGGIKGGLNKSNTGIGREPEYRKWPVTCTN